MENIQLDILQQKNFLNTEESIILKNYLLNHGNFNQKTVNFSGIERNIPRLIQWYGPYPYFYSGLEYPALPFTSELQNIANKISTYLLSQDIEQTFNSVLINLYRDGKDKIGMHSDDTRQLGEEPIIASLSLGDNRTFKMRHKETKERRNFLLEDGDLFIMKGSTQKDWTHGIDPEANKTLRFNLTFRNVIYPNIEKI